MLITYIYIYIYNSGVLGFAFVTGELALIYCPSAKVVQLHLYAMCFQTFAFLLFPFTSPSFWNASRTHSSVISPAADFIQNINISQSDGAITPLSPSLPLLPTGLANLGMKASGTVLEHVGTHVSHLATHLSLSPEEAANSGVGGGEHMLHDNNVLLMLTLISVFMLFFFYEIGFVVTLSISPYVAPVHLAGNTPQSIYIYI